MSIKKNVDLIRLLYLWCTCLLVVTALEAENDRKVLAIDLSVLNNGGADKMVPVDLSVLSREHPIPMLFMPTTLRSEIPNRERNNVLLLNSIPRLYNQNPWRPFSLRSPRLEFRDLIDDALYDYLSEKNIYPQHQDEMLSFRENILPEELMLPHDWNDRFHTNQIKPLSRVRNQRRLPFYKRNVFLSDSWKPGGHVVPKAPLQKSMEFKEEPDNKNTRFFPGFVSMFGPQYWRPGKKDIEKKNVFFSNGWGPGGRRLMMPSSRRTAPRKEAVTSENTNLPMAWRRSRQHWSIPHLLGPYW